MAGGTRLSHLFVLVSDLERARGFYVDRELVAGGVRFSGPPEDQEWGARHAWLIDPDGHRLSIYSEPAAS
jgi:catechol 2,3-dioxygenase-like lactoylglutathione lyase family enzyme